MPSAFHESQRSVNVFAQTHAYTPKHIHNVWIYVYICIPVITIKILCAYIYSILIQWHA